MFLGFAHADRSEQLPLVEVKIAMFLKMVD